MSNSRRLPNFIKYKFYNCTFHRAQKWRKIDQIKQIGRIFFRKSKILKTIQGKYRTCSSVLLMECKVIRVDNAYNQIHERPN